MFKYLSLSVLIAAIAIGTSFANQTKAKVTLPVERTSANDGRQMFTSYCAPCHGIDGRGHGPAAAALKAQPTDLTAISKEQPREVPGHSCRYSLAIRHGDTGARICRDACLGSDPW